MIKKEKIDIVIEKIDKLTDAIEKLVSRNPKTSSVTATHPQAALVSSPRTRKFTKRSVSMPPEMVATIAALQVGEKLNVTAWMRANGVTHNSMRDRIYSYGYTQRKSKNNDVEYRAEKEGWSTFIARTK